MSGAYVPYHMRQNKAVERMLFLDLLTRLNRFLVIKDYRYVSFGGPFLEDFKLIHSHFGITKMISIENDPVAYGRQRFNMPLGCIEPFLKECGEYIDAYEAEQSSIIWLDYASPNWRQQLQEIQALLPKLLIGDVLKVTFNANPESLRAGHYYFDGKRETGDEKRSKLFELLQRQLGDFLPPKITHEDLTLEKFPSVLSKTLEFAISEALRGRHASEDIYFQPLAGFRYSDSQHQMITITGILLRAEQKKDFVNQTAISQWEHRGLEWGEVQEIRVPALTAREKLSIDSMLPTKSCGEIREVLGFSFAPTEEETAQILENYRRYYRYYPNFQRVIF